MRLGILASHPIQYQAPWFRGLAKEINLHVFFAHRQSAVEQGKAGFGVPFEWDVDLLSGYTHVFLKNKARKPGVNHFFGCDTPQIAAEIAAGKFDAFIATGWYLKSYWQAVRACRRDRIPVLVRGDSQLNTTSSFLKRALKEMTHRLALRQFDGFLSVGNRNREYLIHYGMPEHRIFSVPHFIDNEWFALQAKEMEARRSEIRKQWGIPDDAFCVLFCGKFIPKKRPLDLVKAVQLLLSPNSKLQAPRSTLSNIHLLFVGSGELGAQLRSACHVVFDSESSSSQLQTSNFQKPRASFAGFLNQTEIARAYVAADVLVLPSDGRETWGLVVNEAMACGIPAIVSDAVGCAPDLIEEGKTGFTFSMGDCAQLAQRLETLTELKKRRHDFRSVLASKLRDYSVQAAVRGTLEAIKVVSAAVSGKP